MLVGNEAAFEYDDVAGLGQAETLFDSAVAGDLDNLLDNEPLRLDN